MNVSLISKIALFTFATSITSSLIAPSAIAYTFDLSGTFNDGGTLSGTFDFDKTTDTYSNTNITTTGGSTLIGSTYTDDDNVFGNSTGFIFTDDNFEFDLTLDFVASLSSTSPSIALDTTTQEEDFEIAPNIRLISSGTVTPVPVPFEPSANLAIFAVLSLMGVNHYRKTFKS